MRPALPFHVYPTYEDGHETDGESCWCGPRIEWRDPLTLRVHDDPIVIHRDAEQRAAEAV